MWYFSFKKLKAEERTVAYQIGPLFYGIEWGYFGFGLYIIPILFRRLGFANRKYFSPSLMLSAAIGLYTITMRIGKPPHLWHYGQQKDQVKNFEYNGIGTMILPGFAKWKVKEVVGWTRDPGIIEVIGTDGNTHLVPAQCLSDELFIELPPRPTFKPFNGVHIGTPCTSE